MRLFIFGFLILATLIAVLPLPAQAFSLVPCGRSGTAVVGTDTEPCQLRHLFIVINRMINYLVSVAALVAIYQVLAAGFWMATALGNAEVIQKNKQALQHAVVGFAIIVMSFMFVNLLINGLLGKSDAIRPWWDINCLYNITSSAGCPV